MTGLLLNDSDFSRGTISNFCKSGKKNVLISLVEIVHFNWKLSVAAQQEMLL